VTAEPTTDPRDAEIAALRARVADLEAQLAEQARSTAQLVAVSQDKLYWLERWHVDLDRVMRKPGAIQALDTLRASRKVVWTVKKRLRKLRGQA
jgi:uncharacterized coiled-coil protein SlyX